MSSDFGAERPGYRDLIRANVAERLELTDPAVADLSRPPTPDAWSVSITHTVDRGGWLAVPRPAQVGFDLEVRERVREPVIRRMCTPTEIDLVKDFALLWAAKEALFKALARGQPATLSQLRIDHWDYIDDDLFTFTSGPRTAGLAQRTAHHAAALCVVTP